MPSRCSAAVAKPRLSACTCQPPSRSCRATSPQMPPPAPRTKTLLLDAVMSTLQEGNDVQSPALALQEINCTTRAIHHTFMHGPDYELGTVPNLACRADGGLALGRRAGAGDCPAHRGS